MGDSLEGKMDGWEHVWKGGWMAGRKEEWVTVWMAIKMDR